MQAEYSKKCSLCLLKEDEVVPFVHELKEKYPEVEITIHSLLGTLEVVFRSSSAVDHLVRKFEEKFPTFYYGQGKIEEAVHRELIKHQKTLALAESCTGGKIASTLTAMPDASKYFLGSIVAYSNVWKERFLHVSHTTLEEKGAVSRQTVAEMVHGLFFETDADIGVAVSGIAGPSGGTLEKPVGTIYIAIGQRGGKIDAGLIQAPKLRTEAIDYTVSLTLGALWRRLVHNTATFS